MKLCQSNKPVTRLGTRLHWFYCLFRSTVVMVLLGCWKAYDRFRQLKIMTVEPVLFLYIFAASMMSFVFQMYTINQHVSATLVTTISKNSSDAHCRDLAYPNRSFVCISTQAFLNCTNSTASYDIVEEQTSTLILVSGVAGQILSILVALVCGPISDKVGRKPMMLVLSVSGALSAGINLVIMYLKLDIHYFILSSLVSSLGGGIPALITICFSYISDISSGKWLTYRIGVGEGMLFLSAGLCSTVAGVWLNRSNCFYPYIMWLVLAAFLTIGVYVVLYLPESLSGEERLRRRELMGDRPLGWKILLRGLAIVFLPGHSRWRLWLLVYMLGVVYFIASGISSVNNLYLTHPPLNWGPELIGYYDLLISILHGVALVFILPALVALTLHDSLISFVGMLFCASMAVLNIFVQTTWQMFTS